MKTAKYWAKDQVAGTVVAHGTRAGNPIVCWGRSDVSVQAAREDGARRSAAVAKHLQAGESAGAYVLGERFSRELVLADWKGQDGQTVSAVTINSYGANVLNTNGAMFVDVDVDSSVHLDSVARANAEAEALDRLADTLRGEPGLGAFAYRTAAGLRYILTRPGADPTASDTHDLMSQLGSDPLYMKLCRIQACFRARLTPKSWRCGLDPLTAKFPWDGPAEEARVQAWRTQYAAVSGPYAVCHPIGYFGGPTALTPEVARVVAFHDLATKAYSALPLA